MRALRPHLLAIAAVAIALAALAAPASASASGELHAGAGRADITPPTGFYLMGWVRSDAASQGQHTRLFARSSSSSGAAEAGAGEPPTSTSFPPGSSPDAAELLAGRGFAEESIDRSPPPTPTPPPPATPTTPPSTSVAPTLRPPRPLRAELTRPTPSSTASWCGGSRRRSGGRTRPRSRPWPAGARRSSSASPRTARSRRTSPTTACSTAFGEGSSRRGPAGRTPHDRPEVNVLRVDKLARAAGTSHRHLVDLRQPRHGGEAYTFPYYNADHHGRRRPRSPRTTSAAPAACRASRRW